jgi:hypothetical protein
MEPQSQNEISWQGPSHVHFEKSIEWYWSVGIVSLGIIITSILLRNYIFSLFLVIASFTLMLHASKKPRDIEIMINEEGVTLDNYFYPYSSIDSFWVDLNEPAKLLLKSKKSMMPFIAVPIHDNNPEELREFLLNFLDEEVLEDTFFHKVMERLGF